MRNPKIFSLGLVAISFAIFTCSPALAAGRGLPECADGYQVVTSEDGQSASCEPIATTFEDVTPSVGDCVTSDATQPTDMPCAVAYDMPANTDDAGNGDLPVDDQGLPIMTMEKGVDLMSANEPTLTALTLKEPALNSDYLAVFGVLVAALGAFGIAISRRAEQK